MSNQQPRTPLAKICKAVLGGTHSAVEIANQTGLSLKEIFATCASPRAGQLLVRDDCNMIHPGPGLLALVHDGERLPAFVVPSVLNLEER